MRTNEAGPFPRLAGSGHCGACSPRLSRRVPARNLQAGQLAAPRPPAWPQLQLLPRRARSGGGSREPEATGARSAWEDVCSVPSPPTRPPQLVPRPCRVLVWGPGQTLTFEQRGGLFQRFGGAGAWTQLGCRLRPGGCCPVHVTRPQRHDVAAPACFSPCRKSSPWHVLAGAVGPLRLPWGFTDQLLFSLGSARSGDPPEAQYRCWTRSLGQVRPPQASLRHEKACGHPRLHTEPLLLRAGPELSCPAPGYRRGAQGPGREATACPGPRCAPRAC